MERHSRAVIEACDRAVASLRGDLGMCEVSCLLRSENVLRNVAHVTALRVVYEIPREWGGVLWRAVSEGTTQFVPDVKNDPDYLAQDESIRAEVAVPVRIGEDVIGALNVECAEDLGEQEVRIAERAATQLGREIAKLVVFLYV